MPPKNNNDSKPQVYVIILVSMCKFHREHIFSLNRYGPLCFFVWYLLVCCVPPSSKYTPSVLPPMWLRTHTVLPHFCTLSTHRPHIHYYKSRRRPFLQTQKRKLKQRRNFSEFTGMKKAINLPIFRAIWKNFVFRLPTPVFNTNVFQTQVSTKKKSNKPFLNNFLHN